MMPALANAIGNAFTIIRSGAFPAFSGTTGQISHAEGVQTKSGQAITPSGALRVAAIWIATTVLADEVSSLTMKIVDRDDDARRPLQPPSLRALWDEPNPDQTLIGIEATETLSLMLWGASYTMLGWTRGNSLDVRWPLDPARVTLERLDDQGVRLRAQGQGELFNRPGQRPEFAFVPLYTLPGQMEPVSPVRVAAELAGLSVAYQETAARFMKRGLAASAIVTSSEAVSDDVAKEYASRLESLHGGSARAGGIAVFGGKDLKLEKLSMSMVDAQMVEQHKAVFEMLMAIWRVPPTVAGMVEKPSTWGSGIAEFSRGLERFTLRPIVQRRQAAHEKYITKWVNPALQVRYKFDSLLSATPKERVQVQRERLRTGLTSVERVLAQEDEPPFGADDSTFSELALATKGDRRMRAARQHAEAIAAQARAVAELIRAGVEQEKAWEVFGGDPAIVKAVEED
jgi:HK97 family phage portal protein